MATKSKKTTRTPTSRKKSPQPTGAASGATVTKAAVKSVGTSAVEAAVKKVAAAPSSPPPATTADTGNVTELAKVSNGADQAPSVNKKEFVSRVAKRAGLRPNQVRAATEAALEELGRALSAGEELKLPGIGKIQVKRKRDIGDAEVMVCKLRRKKDEISDAAPLAPVAEGR